MARSTLPELGSDALTTLVFRKFRGQRMMYKILLAVTGSVLFLLPLTEITVYATLRGMVDHANSSIALKATASGRIKYIYPIRDRVSAGDTLLIIEHDDVRYQLQKTGHRLELLKTENTALYNLMDGIPPESSIPFHVLAKYKLFLTGKKKHTAQYHTEKEQHERARTLFERSVLSKSEWEAYQSRLQQTVIALKEYERNTAREWSETVYANELAIADLKSDSVMLEEKRKSAHIISPLSGMLTGIEEYHKGQLVQQGQVIAELRTDAPLKFWCSVTPDVFSQIKEKQQAVVRFPGLKPWEHTYFQAKLDHKFARLDSENGFYTYRIPGSVVLPPFSEGIRKKIIAGIPLIVLVKINHHRLYDLLFEKIPGANIRLFFQKPTISVN